MSSPTDDSTPASEELPIEDLRPADPKRMSSGPLAVAKFLIETFSTNARERPSPGAKKTNHVRLITIAPSHYCEKARWIFDLLEADLDSPYYYTEDAHPPAFHSYPALEASKNVASATPMIVFAEDGEEKCMYKSDVILSKFMPSLYPKEIEQDVKEMETYLGRKLGPTIRCFAYHHMLSDLSKTHAALVNLCANKKHVANVEHILFDKMLDKGINVGIRKSMKINEKSSAVSDKALRDLFKELSDRLEKNGGEYLMDDKDKKSYGFTAADLSLAALSFPLIRPYEMKDWNIADDDLPESVKNLMEEVTSSTAGQHVIKIYKKHRLVGTNIDHVVMKTANRDKYPWQS